MQHSDFYFESEKNFIWVARQLFSQRELHQLREEVNLKRQMFQPVTERDFAALKVGVAPDQIRLNPDYFNLWKNIDLATLTDYLPEFNQITYPPIHRVMISEADFTPWHQDYAYIRRLGPGAHHRIITCWLPLDDEPSTLPTVQLVWQLQQREYPHLKRPGLMNHMYLDSSCYQFEPEQLMTFELNSGDALFFGQDVPHRTFFSENKFSSRSSFEFRLTTPEQRIDGKDYYDLQAHKFYLFKA